MSAIVSLTGVSGSAHVNGKSVRFSYAEVRKDGEKDLTAVFTIEGLSLRASLELIGAAVVLADAGAPIVDGVPAPVAPKPAAAPASKLLGPAQPADPKPAASRFAPKPAAAPAAAPAAKPAAAPAPAAKPAAASAPAASSRFAPKPKPAPEPVQEETEESEGGEDPNPPCQTCGEAPEITGTGICAGCLDAKEEKEVPEGLANAKKLREAIMFLSDNYEISDRDHMVQVCNRYRKHVDVFSLIAEEEFDQRIERACDMLGLFGAE